MPNGHQSFRQGRPPALLSLLAALAACTALATVAAAQDVPPELVEQALRRTGLTRQELSQRLQAQGVAVVDTSPPPGRVVLPAGPRVILPFDLESVVLPVTAAIATPAPAESTLFGADFFRLDPGVFAPPAFGPVPSDYLLGPGDQVCVDVFGEVEFRIERVVDRDGSLILPKGGKVLCAGRTLAQATREVREKLAGSYAGIDPAGEGGTTFVDVSLGALRAIRVFVVGEARQPGAYELTSLSTAFTALYAAGGPNAQGSLRRVRVLRGNEVLAELDFYGYLLEGRRGDDPVLRDGDTVLIPARTTTVRVQGEVRRPQAYELKDGEDVLDLIRYAGGFTAEAVADVVHVARIVPLPERRPEQPDRVQTDLNLLLKMKHLLRDADIVSVDRIPERLENWVEVQGNVKNPGRYQYRDGMTVADLVRQAGGLWADTLPERALIERVDPDLTYRTIEVPLADAMSGASVPEPLQTRDKLRVFSRWDLQDRYRVSMSGEVRTPGEFDFREGMTLGDLILLAGGLRESADVLHAQVSRLRRDAVGSRDIATPPLRTVEVVDVALGEDWLRTGGEFALEPHDRVAVRRLPWWELPRVVTLQGEVYYPGTYVLESPDERLSTVIARAGGLKPTAYAPGARIVRGKDDIGNMALDLDRALTKPGSEQDAILEQGDDIRIPARPYTVKVAGAVGFPTSIVYERGRSLGEYIARAGGYAHLADKWKTHVVYPNGMSKQIRRIWGDPEVMPGSTIVVPDKQPESGPGSLETLKEIASILASAATVYLVIDRTAN